MYHFSSPTGYKPLTFRHFGRKGYSLFAALGREVKVGVLTVATLSTAAPALASAGGQAAMGGAANDGNESMTDSVAAPDVLLDEAVIVSSCAPMTANVAARTVMTFSREDIAAAGVTSLNDVVKLCAGVDVRQRGAFGVQTDIAVDGGTFDQITILLNGVNISSPHTGHLSADFPVTAQDIERIEVLEGAAARVYGTSAFTGTINIVTRREPHEVALHGYGGMYGYGGAEARLSQRFGVTSHHLSGGYTRSDGATPNSQFSSARAFYQGRAVTPVMLLDYQLGYSYKPYGANTFYGASSQDQWESNERWMAAVKGTGSTGCLNWAPKIYWNRWYDHYQWHKDSPAGENFHQVDVYGLALSNWVNWTTGGVDHKTCFTAEMRNEGIRSTKLGEPLEESQWGDVHRGPADGADRYSTPPTAGPFYKFAANRTNISGFLEHNIILPRLTVSAGVLANLNTALDTRWRFSPGIDVSYRPTGHWKLFASWNMAMRMPTFTDLYYSGVGIEGTHDLKPERANDLSLKAQYSIPSFTADAGAFYSHKSDMIDWVVLADNPLATDAAPGLDASDPKNWVYRSGNYTLDNWGLRANAAWMPRQLWGEQFPLRKVGLQYCFIHEDLSYPVAVLSSKYAMEYVRHKLVLNADARLFRLKSHRGAADAANSHSAKANAHSTKASSRGTTASSHGTTASGAWRGGELNLGLTYRYCDRTGMAGSSYGLLDARLSWDAPRYSVYVDAHNVLDTEYYDFSYIRQPGLWVVGGLKLKF